MTAALLPAVAAPAFARLKAVLDQLGTQPPQVLLLEGGNEEQRLALAHYWAMRLNCPQALQTQGPPCMTCPACLQIATGEFLDLSAYDGRISNKDDEENPGPVRAFNMQQVRELKSRLRDAPHGDGKRLVLLMGLSLTRDEAANALLKALEEPSATTCFVLLAPQREQLLPTLVSRSFCLTLPWPDSRVRDAEISPWEDCLAEFLRTGQSLPEKLAAKNAVDAPLAERILLASQKALSRVLARRPDGPLDDVLDGLSPHGLALCGRWLNEAQDMLRYGVTPARLLEALAARLYVLRRDHAA